MTSPDGARPDGAFVSGGTGQSSLADLNNLTEAEAKRRMRAPLVGTFTRQRDGIWSVIGDLFSVVRGDYHGVDQWFKDQQDVLNERFDLLADVSGYAVAYMGENRYKDRRSWQLLEFNKRLGPNKRAAVEDNGLTLEKGTWVLNAQATHDQHVDRMTSRLRVEITDPAGRQWSRKESYGEVLPGKLCSRQVAHTAVIPEDGYKVKVYGYYNVGTVFGIYPRLLWRGGTVLTHLSAFRLDLSAENPVSDEDVPTVGDSQGNDGE